jgi:hypothetical protein
MSLCHGEAMTASVENGPKNSRSVPFRFSLLSVRFRGILFSSEIDPYLFRFSSRFKSI